MITHLSEIFMEKLNKLDVKNQFILQIVDIINEKPMQILLSNGIVKKNFFLYTKIENSDIEVIKNSKNKIIQCDLINSKGFYFIFSFKLLLDCDSIVGKPIIFDEYEKCNFINQRGNNMIPENFIKFKEENNIEINNIPEVNEAYQNFDPINTLITNNNNVCLRVRCIDKGDIKNFKNNKEGKLFNCKFIDNTGSIMANFFNNEVDTFYDKIKERKVYKINKIDLKISTYNKGKLQIYFKSNSEIKEIPDNGEIVKNFFNFYNISQIQNTQKDELIDLIGIIKINGNLESIKLKNGNNATKKKVVIIDENEICINLILWDKQAINFEYKKGEIILFRNLKINEFNNNKQLSYTYNTKTQINIPESKRYKDIIKWKLSNFEKINNKEDIPNGYTVKRPFSTIESITEIQNINESKYFNVFGYITFIKDNFFYISCINEECKKKVVKNGNVYECEKCNLQYEQAKPRYLPLFKIVDSTGCIFATSWDNYINDLIFGMKCEELIDLQRNSEEEFNKYLDSRKFIPYKLNIKLHENHYNGEKKMNYKVVKIQALGSNYTNLLYDYFNLTLQNYK